LTTCCNDVSFAHHHNHIARTTSVSHSWISPSGSSNVANLDLERFQLLLEVRVLLSHLLIFGFPLVAFGFESLDFSLEVTCLYVGLAEPVVDTRESVQASSHLL
jgi:hypothetical protein